MSRHHDGPEEGTGRAGTHRDERPAAEPAPPRAPTFTPPPAAAPPSWASAVTAPTVETPIVAQFTAPPAEQVQQPAPPAPPWPRRPAAAPDFAEPAGPAAPGSGGPGPTTPPPAASPAPVPGPPTAPPAPVPAQPRSGIPGPPRPVSAPAAAPRSGIPGPPPASGPPGSGPPASWPSSSPPGTAPDGEPDAAVFRGHARVGPDRPEAPATSSAPPATPRRQRRPGTIGGLHVLQVMWWQVLAALVVAALARGGTLLVAAASVLAALLLVPSALPVRRRWLYRWFAIWLRYRLRRRTMAPRQGDVRAGLLAFAEPSATTGTIEIDGEPVGLVAHAGGIAAVLELWPSDGALLAGPPRPLPAPAALLPADDPQAPPASVQLLVQVLPAPSPHAGGTVVAESYRELAGIDVPAQRRAWLALQVRRTPAAYDDAALRPALALAVRRLRRRLRHDQVPNRLLDPDELLAATADLVGLETVGPGVYSASRGRAVAGERWRALLAGAMVQACYGVARWPGPSWRVDPLLCGVPATAMTFAVAVARDPARDGEVAAEVAIRLAALDGRQILAADQALAQTVRESGGAVERLDGEQRAGLAATLPFGGFLR